MKCAAGADFRQIMHPNPPQPPRQHTEIWLVGWLVGEKFVELRGLEDDGRQTLMLNHPILCILPEVEPY